MSITLQSKMFFCKQRRLFGGMVLNLEAPYMTTLTVDSVDGRKDSIKVRPSFIECFLLSFTCLGLHLQLLGKLHLLNAFYSVSRA